MTRPPAALPRIVLLCLLALCCAGTEPALAAKAESINPPGAGAASDETTAGIGGAVVKVFATIRNPDTSKPWSKQAPSDITGSGVIIDGKRILTNAHVVLYASQVQIQANQAGDKLSATVVAVAPGIDLAVLKLDDESFFATHAPLPRATHLPQIRDAVLAYGYPTGGTSLSITKGIVSRIEYASYNYPVSGLRIQIDAAINPGNSGGAAVVGDRMIGLAFSRAGGDTQNIGYIIPNEEIDLFLQDIADGHYDGKPAMYDELQSFENSALRTFLKLDKGVQGIVVHRPASTATGYPLKEWDVITRIGDTPIDDQGMVKLNADLRVGFQYRVQQVTRNGKVPLSIMRAGRPMTIQLPVSAASPRLIPDLWGDYPSYFIYGPLVFSRATRQYVHSLASGGNVALGLGFIGSPLISGFGAAPDAEHEELVVVPSPFFPSDASKGYGNPAGTVVERVNGTPIRSLAHLVSVLRDLQDDYVVFDFANRLGESLVFSRSEMLATTEGILADNGVRAQGSADMLAIWQRKGAGN
jgi:S1-C subfamily serine protease